MLSDSSSLYPPLDPPPEPIHPIRLLRIRRGREHEDIVCSFFQSYPDERAPAYKALSYRWSDFSEGMTFRNPQLIIDGHDSSAFEAGENLYAAIRQIRLDNQDVLLWADALCIDQKNNVEKGHQVKQMGKVYEAAEEVLIWLGSSTPDIEFLFAFVTQIDRNATYAQAGITRDDSDWRSLCASFMEKERPSTLEMDAIRRGLTEILARGWWNRVWILQEVAMARTAKIMCGSATCPARTFALLPSFMEGLQVSPHKQAVLDIMPRWRRDTWWNARRDLHFLLGKFAESEAGWPRDKVYALLGMSEDAYDPRRFYPCYVKSDSQVLQDTVSFLLFGEVADANTYAFPEFEVHELHLPLIQLAEKTLRWTLSQGDDSLREPSQNTAEALARHINQGSLKTEDLLLSLASKYNREGEVQDVLNGRNFALGVDFGDAHDTLTFNPEDASESLAPITFAFPRRQPGMRELKDDGGIQAPKAPIDTKHGDIEAQIEQLVEAGSSKEEIMRAYVWAGDRDAVERLIKEGGDVNGADEDGCTALHMAAWLGHADISSLLLQHVADVNQADNRGNTGLNFAVGGLQMAGDSSPYG